MPRGVGKSWELIVTAPGTLDHRAFEKEFGIPLTAVGHVEAAGAHGQGLETQNRGQPVPLPRGHSHFSA